MCLLCAAGLDGQWLARRAHVLQLLTLVEHPMRFRWTRPCALPGRSWR
jgi:hypothetical protein